LDEVGGEILSAGSDGDAAFAGGSVADRFGQDRGLGG
jgi:hypothetical protein